MKRKLQILVPAAILLGGCTGFGPLGRIVQPPQVAQAPGRPAEVRLLAPPVAQPAGGAGVRVWLDITNPNTFGFTVQTLQATLLLEGTRAATGDFPLGLPLAAGQQTVVPLDLSISFLEVPGLAGALRTAAGGGRLAYDLDGTIGVDAGRFGTPAFGPLRLATGEVRILP